MKKFLSILLALALVLSLGTVAFATGGEPYTDHETVTLTKNYKLANPGTESPAETFAFENVECVSVTDAAEGVTTETAPKLTVGNIEFTWGDATVEGCEGTLTIELPDFPSVGIYTYTFNEVDRGTAGVDYRSETITLKVTVLQGEDGLIRVPAIYAEGAGQTKIDSFTNTYSAGSLAVTKEVTGNMGDQKKAFDVTVTFEAPEGDTVQSTISYTLPGETESKTISGNWSDSREVKLSLKHDETVNFTNIPYGVTYTVEEDDYTGEGYLAAQYDDNANGTINAAATSTTITNNKDGGVIDTGVFMDSLPYVLLLVGACAGLVVFFARRRMTHKG